MPRLDELLGVATFAAAGMIAAIALQPMPVGSAIHGVPNALAAAGITATQLSAAPNTQQPQSRGQP